MAQDLNRIVFGIDTNRSGKNLFDYGQEKIYDHAIDALARYTYNDVSETNKLFKYFEVNKGKEIVDVIFNPPATIVFWGDGTKTVVKCNEEEFDPEKGLAMAIAKKFLGTSESKGDYYNVFKKWIPAEEVKTTEEITLYADNVAYGALVTKLSQAFKIPLEKLGDKKGE